MGEARRRAKENEAWLERLRAELRRQDRELADLAAMAGEPPAAPPAPARPRIGFVRA